MIPSRASRVKPIARSVSMSDELYTDSKTEMCNISSVASQFLQGIIIFRYIFRYGHLDLVPIEVPC